MGDSFVCRVCGFRGAAETYSVREMLHGLRERFEYFMCAECGALQIAEIPKDLGKYYPQDYYSLVQEKPIRRWLKDQRLKYIAGGMNPVGWAFHRLKSRGTGHMWVPQEMPMDSKILDIGCGRGEFIEEAFLRGYRCIRGIDPFLSDSNLRSWPFVIERKSIEELGDAEKFDFIIMNHSLEHMRDGVQLLKDVREHMSASSVLCVRIPMVAEGWKIYGTDWVGIDAPRHIVIHTQRSIAIAASRAGLKIVKSWCDSNGFHYWASEQYQKDIPAMAANSWYIDPSKSVFTQEDIDKTEIRAVEANARGEGDQSVYWMVRV
ncbi:MAG: class I SAM-dependent methyltransferase [Chthonomonadales bacterium]